MLSVLKIRISKIEVNKIRINNQNKVTLTRIIKKQPQSMVFSKDKIKAPPAVLPGA